MRRTTMPRSYLTILLGLTFTLALALTSPTSVDADPPQWTVNAALFPPYPPQGDQQCVLNEAGYKTFRPETWKPTDPPFHYEYDGPAFDGSGNYGTHFSAPGRTLFGAFTNANGPGTLSLFVGDTVQDSVTYDPAAIINLAASAQPYGLCAGAVERSLRLRKRPTHAAPGMYVMELGTTASDQRPFTGAVRVTYTQGRREVTRRTRVVRATVRIKIPRLRTGRWSVSFNFEGGPGFASWFCRPTASQPGFPDCGRTEEAKLRVRR